MEQVDLVVFWVNENDMSGRQDFNFWRDKEINERIQSPANSQAGGAERTRDRGDFKYGFRAVEKNCSGIRKVFLVLARPTQVPDGLNTDAEKLRIVYHDEIVPHELLPTFNPFVVYTYIHRIPDLSEHFLVSDDDCFFMNKVGYDHYFNCGKPVMGMRDVPYYVYQSHTTGWNILKNTYTMTGQCGCGRHYYLNHLINPHLKSFEKDWYDKHEKIIRDHMDVSRFRHPHNVCMTVAYLDALRNTNKVCFNKMIDDHSQYMEVHTANFGVAEKLEVVCFNDVGMSDQTSAAATKRFLEFLEKHFPEKSSFEK